MSIVGFFRKRYGTIRFMRKAMKTNWILIALILFSTGCNVSIPKTPQLIDQIAHIDCPQFLPKDDSIPQFLKGVYPTGVIKKLEYDEALLLVNKEGNDYYAGGISATISAEGISQSVIASNRNDRSSLLTENITLAINGSTLSEAPTEILDGLMPQGPFYFNWALDLNPGYYQTTLIFNLDTGETKTYSWSFCIIP